MLAEGERRASAAGIANTDWRQADPATARLDEYDLLISAFGVMFWAGPESIDAGSDQGRHRRPGGLPLCMRCT
jgi:hypothetical protein